MNERFPDFYLAGTPKSGTTSLHDYLGQHPQVFVPVVKEPHFFACPEVKDNSYYKVDFVDNEQHYLSLFKDCGENQLAGDCSTSYMYSEHAASRIYVKNPRAKFIVVLRNPVDRAISHYLMDERGGYLSASLMECITHPEAYQPYYQQYIEIGRYAPQLERLYDRFGRDSVLVCLYEDLQEDIQKTLEIMFHFLGVPANVGVDFSNQKNTSSHHRFAITDRIIKTPLWSLVRSCLPSKLLLMLQSLFLGGRPPDFSQERKWLQEFYAGDIEKLEKIIGRDLGKWR